jgi:hypothetical protein
MLDSTSSSTSTTAIDTIDTILDGAGPGPGIGDIRSPIVSTGADGVRTIHSANSLATQLVPLNTAAWLTNLEQQDIRWLTANHRFPKPLYIYGRNNRRVMCFVRGEIEGWILEKVHQRDAGDAAVVVIKNAA